MKLKVHRFTFNAFQENSYVVVADSGNCVIIDPGCYDRTEEMQLTNFIKENELSVKAILNTHAHIDHVLGNAFAVETFNSSLYLHQEDIATLKSVANYAAVYGFEGYKPSPMPEILLEDGQQLSIGDIEFEVFFTPGHAPGHVVFYNKENDFVINGDVLFQGSFGRVDLPAGDMETLKKSIHEVMFKLPESTKVYCGHGPETTIGQEKKSNYILNF